MSSHAIQDAESSLIKAEPVIAAHAGAAVVGYAGTLLVTHGVITNDQASVLTQEVLPAVVAGLLVLLGVIVRRFVSPAALFAQRVEEEVQARLKAELVTRVVAGSTYATGGLTAAPTPTQAVPAVPADAGADVLAQADAIHPMPAPPNTGA